MGNEVKFQLRISASGSDDAELMELSRSLRSALLTLDIDDARPLDSGQIEPGAKAGQSFAFGALVVTAAPLLVGGVVDVVVSWLKRQTIEIEIDIGDQRLKSSVTRQQRDALVAAFLDQARSDAVGP